MVRNLPHLLSADGQVVWFGGGGEKRSETEVIWAGTGVLLREQISGLELREAMRGQSNDCLGPDDLADAQDVLIILANMHAIRPNLSGYLGMVVDDERHGSLLAKGKNFLGPSCDGVCRVGFRPKLQNLYAAGQKLLGRGDEIGRSEITEIENPIQPGGLEGRPAGQGIHPGTGRKARITA